MRRLALTLGILALLIVPAVALAQYDYPAAPSGGGGAADTGGSSGGGISIGGGEAPDIGMGGGGDVAIVDFGFEPGTVRIDAGGTVTWRNTGAAPHTATAFTGAFDSGTLEPGGSYSETFSDPGVYMYHCEIHPNMVGTVQVSGA